MTKIAKFHDQWMADSDYRAAYDALEDEFALAAALIEARANAGLTQEQLASRMNTTQSVVARLEGGRARPSTRTLERFAKATGTRLKISFEENTTQRSAHLSRSIERMAEARSEARMLTRLLTLKFGLLSPENQQRINEGDADTLLA